MKSCKHKTLFDKYYFPLTSKAFTLAEVLITLGIIGVVAAITIPTLMNTIQDQQFKTAYKKAYSTASQAWLNAYNNGNLSVCSQWNDDATHTCCSDNFNAFKQEMHVSKDCDTNTTNCWNMSGEQSWVSRGRSFPTSSAQAFIDNSGVAWSKLATNPSAEVLLDVNGNSPPNKYGRDRAILVFYYYSSNYYASNTWVTYKANIPAIFPYPDFPNADTTTWPNLEQLARCPSMNTHPCYYQSWITGAQ